MSIHKTIIYALIILLYGGLFFVQSPFLFSPFGWVCTFFYLLILPGLYLSNLFDLPLDSLWEKTAVYCSLSIAHLIGFGFVYNQLVLFFRLNWSLNSQHLFFSYAIYFTIFVLFASVFFYIKKKPYIINFQILKEIPVYIIVSFLPVFAVVGALLLNNGIENVWTILPIILILPLVVLLGLLEKKVSSGVFSFSVLIIGLTLLLSYALRSNYLVGWDIHQEFRVFQITKERGLWSMANYPSAYNATLSITLLPTMISAFTHIQDVYIYKLVYPLLFSITPVLIYIIAKQYLGKFFAFLAAFFFIAQSQFMTQMPALNRQEIAFIFFALLLYSLLEKRLSKWQRGFLFITSSLSLVVSHYSSSYVTAGLLLSTYIFYIVYFIFRFVLKKTKWIEIPDVRSTIQLWMVVFFCACTVLWYGVYTQAAGDVQVLVKKVYSAIGRIHSEELKSDQARTAIWGATKGYSADDTARYTTEIREQYISERPWASLYPEEITSKYSVYPMYSRTIPVVNAKLRILSNNLNELSKKSIKGLLVVGISYLCFSLLKKNRYSFDLEVLSMNINSMIFLTALSVLPVLSLFYNFERLYQQSLMVLGVGIIVGTLFLTRHKIYLAKTVLIVLMLIYFVNSSGLQSQLVGGGTSLSMNNFGEDFDRFYVFDSELKSATWLEANRKQENTISLDQYSWLRFQSGTRINGGGLFDLSPGVIPQDGYVYLSRANEKEGISRVSYKGQFVGFSVPKPFLEKETNLIYSNRGSKIYR